MFNKPKDPSQGDGGDRPQTTTIEQFRPSSIRSSAIPSYEGPSFDNGSVIGSDLTILGENLNIISRESLRIDGVIHGDVSGKRVRISSGGMVVGTVNAESVEIDGGVRGAVRAHSVRLNDEAKVDGEILHQVLSIAEGAEFEGSVRRSNDPSELKPNLEIGKVAPKVAASHAQPSTHPAGNGMPSENKDWA